MFLTLQLHTAQTHVLYLNIALYSVYMRHGGAVYVRKLCFSLFICSPLIVLYIDFRPQTIFHYNLYFETLRSK